jgi:hypothetical protein
MWWRVKTLAVGMELDDLGEGEEEREREGELVTRTRRVPVFWW